MSYLQGAPADEGQFPTLLQIKSAFGFIPNFFRAQTFRPDLIDAEAGLIGTILLKDGALTRAQKEYIFLTCSAANLSTYCVTAHCEIVRLLGIAGPEPEQIAINPNVADIPARDKALLDFAKKLNSRPREIAREDVEVLRREGFTETHVLETVVMVGLTKFANYVAFGLGTVPDFDSSRISRGLGLNSLNPETDDSSLIHHGVDPDGELVRRAKAGELAAFDEIVLRHHRRIYRVLMGVTRSHEDSEDGIQNVFLSAFQHLESFEGASKLITWLTRIAINEGAARLRARRDTDTLDDPATAPEEPYRPQQVSAWDGNPEEIYSQKEIREKVERELLRIPVKYRIPVMLRDLQDFNALEAAEILGLGVPALKSRLLRGRLMLREAIAPILGRRAANV
jgi:RNA polymerase sigma-70 factor (ECF subfamily)